jgi:hypothetical protein
MLAVEGFQKFAVIPFGMSRIFEGRMPQQIGANHRKNRSIQVKISSFTILKMLQKKSEFLPVVLWILITPLFWKTLAEESWIS